VTPPGEVIPLHDTLAPPTERDPMVAPETLSAIGRELTAVGEHVANVERQMGSFRHAVWEELQGHGERLSDLKIRFARFEDNTTQTLQLQNALLERILLQLSKA
jgi:hypothetical protein